MDCDLGYIQIIDNEVNLYYDFDQKFSFKPNNYSNNWTLIKQNLVNSYNKNNLNAINVIKNSINSDFHQLSDKYKLNDKCINYHMIESEQLNINQKLINEKLVSSESQLKFENKINRRTHFDSVQTDLSAIKNNNKMDVEPKTTVNHNIYRGLYPIKEVKQYYKREFYKGKPLYICLWNDCGFKTWKYSQHIARHIHLKHIGIKELKCEEPNCEKTFKRPESLVQHQKNHLCGFGIDSEKMKDPSNVCGVKNIKKYYFRELDNDYYVFGCKWIGCQFVTNNSGSIRRHVHNQHLCPHSVNNHNGLDTSSNKMNSSIGSHSLGTSNQLNSSKSEVNLPLIEIIEFDRQQFSQKTDSSQESVIAQNIDNPFAITTNPVVKEIESNFNRRSSGGLYSLKNYSELYRKVRVDGEVLFKCNCNQFTTKSQISLVRHIWSDIGRNVFECDMRGCDAKFDNEFNLYKHKKFDHNYDNNNMQSISKTIAKVPQASDQSISNHRDFDDKMNINSNINNSINDTVDRAERIIATVPQTIEPLIDKTQLISHMNDNGNRNITNTRTRRSSSGIYSLKNFSRHFRKIRINDQVFYKCECGQFTTKSSVSLVRHIWIHKGINSFECDLCNARYDNESSLYRHRKFDHNSKNLPNLTNILVNSNANTSYANITSNQLKPNVNHFENNFEFNKFCEERRSSISNDSVIDVSQVTNNSLISQASPMSNSFITTAKPIGLKPINYTPDRSGVGLYSLKNYGKYYKKLKINEEVSYKCTVCGYTSRSQVSLIRHIWVHTGMNRFECEIPECKASFSSESELYKHRKTHNTTTTPKAVITSTPKIPNSNQMPSNYIILNNSNLTEEESYSTPIVRNESVIQVPQTIISVPKTTISIPKTINSIPKTIDKSLSSQIRKNHAMNSRPGLYSLKTYAKYFRKVKLIDGFNYVCNCGEFTTRSQVSLVRHIWLHQSAEENNQIIANGSQEFQSSIPVSNGMEFITVDGDMADFRNEDNFNAVETESAMTTSIASNSPSRRNLTFKSYKFKNSSTPEMQNAVEMQDASEISAEDLYFNNLIVKIEDRGYFCQWPECDFNDSKKETVILHIREDHMSDQNGENDDFMQADDYGNDIDSYDDERDANISDYMIKTEEMIRSPEQSSSQLVTFEMEDFEQLIDRELRNGTVIYLCKASNCFFETALNSSIVSHIREHHLIDTSMNGNLTVHDVNENTVLNLNRFKCKFNYCGASFPSLGCLVEHQKIHGNQSPIKAKQLSTKLVDDQEAASFSETSDSFQELSNEYKIETFGRSSKGYSYNGELGIQNADKYSETVQENDGITVSVCKWSNCGYKSHVRGNMIRHIRKHTGDKPFICNINNCGQRFAYSTDVKIHQRKYH